jgi:hypothetical protein
MSKSAEICPECGHPNVNPTRGKRKTPNIPMVPFLALLATVALTLATAIVAVSGIGSSQRKAPIQPANAPDAADAAAAEGPDSATPEASEPAWNLRILQVDSSSYPDVDIYFDVGNPAKDIDMDRFEIQADSLGGQVSAQPLMSSLLRASPTSVIFVDTSANADVPGARAGIAEFFADQGNYSKYVEIYSASGEEIAYSPVSQARTKNLALSAPDVTASLYDSMYDALLKASYRSGPKSFTAIISTPDHLKGNGVSDIIALSKEVGIPVNVIISGDADKMALGDLAHGTGGLAHSGNTDIPEALAEFQSAWDGILKASFRIEDSWYDWPISLKYSGKTISLEKELEPLGVLAIGASASSLRDPVDEISYNPENVIDRFSDTAWIEGVNGSGEGEWIKIEFGRVEKISSVLLQNGYWKNPLTLANNSRIQNMELAFSDGSETLVLDDPALDPTSFSKPKGYAYALPKTHYSSFVTITIAGIHPDRQYLETCLSYVGFYRQ